MRVVRHYGAPLAIYAATRALTAVFVLLTGPGRVVSLESLPGYHAAAPHVLPPDYATVMTSWDGQWYLDIAENGYPDSALGEDGRPAQTSLAFFPLYPLLVRAIMLLTRTDFNVAAPATSLVIGAAAVLTVFLLVEQCVDRRRALVTVALISTFASAPVLQAAYSESLGLFLLASILLLLHQRQYLWCLVPLLLLGLTRNVTVALIPVILLHWAWRMRQTSQHPSRRLDPTQKIPHVQISLLLVTASVATVLWPTITWVITGEPDAYVRTLQAWPGFSGSVLRSPWVALVASNAWLLFIVLIGMFGGATALWRCRARYRWGPELAGWALSYPFYLFAVSSTTFSIVRYLVLAFPLALFWAPDPTTQRSNLRQNAYIAVLAVAGLAGQWLWVTKLLVFAGPKGGWGYP